MKSTKNKQTKHPNITETNSKAVTIKMTMIQQFRCSFIERSNVTRRRCRFAEILGMAKPNEIQWIAKSADDERRRRPFAVADLKRQKKLGLFGQKENEKKK